MSRTADTARSAPAGSGAQNGLAAPAGGRPVDGRLRLLLAAGGDCRIWPDPASGRNRYGTPVCPAPDEVWLSSSTASAVSENGYRAARDGLAGLFGEADVRYGQEEMLDAIRARIAALYCGPACEVVLAPSGTDVELVTLAIAASLLGEPVTNVVVAPDETGSGVMLAAGGASFLEFSSFAAPAIKGCRLAGWDDADIEAVAVAIRTPDGAPRSQAEVDADAARLAEAALARGRNVLLHVLDTSKTGLAGLSRDAAAGIAASAPGRVLVAVDACQLRCGAETVRSDLERGFMVQITGSKFAGGPAFCGALMLPPEICGPLAAGALRLPVGLAGHSALLDWPERLRPYAVDTLSVPANIGLALRWTAALADLELYQAVDPAVRRRLLALFEDAVGDMLPQSPVFAVMDQGPAAAPGPRGLVPLVALDDDGNPASFNAAADLHGRLRKPGDRPAVHLGQAVALGRLNVLRVSASMQHVIAVAERLRGSGDIDAAFAPLASDIEAVLRKLAVTGN